MRREEFDAIVPKISELKVFFEFGHRTVPLVEEVGAFVEKAGPIIEGMRSLVDVASVKLPRASEQLGKVNDAAEKASTEILNTVDMMTTTIESLRSLLLSPIALASVNQSATRVGMIIETLSQKFKGDSDMADLLNFWDLHSQSLKSVRPDTALVSNIDKLAEDCTTIMLALQVQDITGQQIAAVIGLMQAIGDVLQSLLEKFPQDDEKRSVPEIRFEITPEVGATERQKMVDALLEKARVKEFVNH